MDHDQNLASESARIMRSARSHALSMARMATMPFAQFILDEADALPDVPQPLSAQLVEQQRQMAETLRKKIAAIAHSGNMAKIQPTVASQIAEETKTFCERNPLDADCSQAADALRSAVSRLCMQANSARITGQ